MGALPPPDAGLVRRIDDVADRFTERWITGRPTVTLTRFGRVVAPVAPASPSVDFLNRPLFLGGDSVEVVDDLLAHYRAAGVAPWFEVSPSPGFEAVARRLAAGGAVHTGFAAVHYGLPVVPDLPAADRVEVREARDDERHLFGSLLAAGHGIPDEHHEAAIAGMATWFDQPTWRRYIATVDGEPAAAAAMSLDDGIGYLANAATVPRARNRGAQTALVAQRIADARDAGAELVTSLTEFASASHRTMHRVGLRLAYLRAAWRGPDPTGRLPD